MEYPMKLIVGRDAVEIETVPEIMANASSVFRCMLQPNRFAEGYARSQAKPFVITLEADDPSAMRILCDIFHLRSDNVPIRDMTSDTMAELATLVDKYDCAAAIQPWPILWLRQVLGPRQHLDVKSMNLQEVEKWIHISCQLGFEEHFRQCTAALISRVSREDFDQGDLLSQSPTIQGVIEDTRAACIREFHQLCYVLIEELKLGNHCRFSLHDFGRSGEQEEFGREDKQEMFDCSSLALGNAFLAAKEICSGENWEKVENWTESLDHYHERLTTFSSRLNGSQRIMHKNHDYSYQFEPTRKSHYGCSRSGTFLEQVRKIYRTATVGLDLTTWGNHAYRTPVTSSDSVGE